MLAPEDQLRAQFKNNDAVRFKYARTILEGVLIRCNPKRGVVLIDQQEYTVPYECMISNANNTARSKHMEAVQNFATELLYKHDLKSWNFKFDHSTRRAGCCDYRSKTISLAFDLAQSGSEEDVRDTILHEIAHAIVGKKHNHDATWRAKAIEIGCSGKRTHTLTFSTPRWNVTCKNRCWNQTAQQRNSKLICRSCGEKVIYSPYTTMT